ncbi:MAG TPA: nuclear transport factor 2 family protein [Solirubrobacteraceae bacterium]
MGNKPSPGRITVRRTILVLAAAVVGLLAVGAAMAASHGSSSEADRLRAIERTRLQALVDADTATARKLIAPDFQLINPGGGVSGREDYMQAIDAGVIDYLVFEPVSPIAVRLSGDSAVLRYQVSFDLVVGGDTHVTHQGWITELYERRHGRWQIVWEQATAIPNNFDLFIESIKPVS